MRLLTTSIALLAATSVFADPATPRAPPVTVLPLAGTCEVQLRVRLEWTTSASCVIQASGNDLRLTTREGDYRLTGSLVGDTDRWELRGRLACPLDDCPAPVAVVLMPRAPNEYRGAFRVGDDDVAVSIVRVPGPPPTVTPPTPPPVAAVAPLPAGIARSYEYRLRIESEWTGPERIRLTPARDGSLALASIDGMFADLRANVRVVRGELVGDIAVASVDTGKTRHAKLRLRSTGDGAWSGTIPLDGIRRAVAIELRPFVDGDAADFVGDRTCRVRRGSAWGQPFRCDIMDDGDDVWVGQDLSGDATESLSGSVVRTPAGFRVWGDFLYDCGSENGCGGWGPIEFTRTSDGWLGRLVLKRGTVVIEMRRARSGR